MSADIELARLLEHPAIWRGRSAARAEVVPTGFAAFDAALPGGGWPRTGLTEILVPRFGVGELSLLIPTLAALTQRPQARWCAWVAPPLEPFAPALAAHGVVLEHVLVVRAGHQRAASKGAPRTSKGMSRASRAGGVGQGSFTRAGGVVGQGSSTRAGGVGQGPSTRAGKVGQGSSASPSGSQRETAALWAFEQVLGSGACDAALAWSPRVQAHEVRRLQLAAERGRTLGFLFRPHGAAQESSPAVLRVLIEPVRPEAAGVRVTLLKSRGGMRGSIDLSWQG